MKRSKKLPTKPSNLILLALTDLAWIEKSKRYTVDMLTWHESYNHKCSVCFAGSVMARTLEANRKEDLSPSSFHLKTTMSLNALNSFRMFDLVSAYSAIDRKMPPDLPEYAFLKMPEYHSYPSDWWNAMLDMVGMLKAFGE